MTSPLHVPFEWPILSALAEQAPVNQKPAHHGMASYLAAFPLMLSHQGQTPSIT
jgi:hypothetical protein